MTKNKKEIFKEKGLKILSGIKDFVNQYFKIIVVLLLSIFVILVGICTVEIFDHKNHKIHENSGYSRYDKKLYKDKKYNKHIIETNQSNQEINTEKSDGKVLGIDDVIENISQEGEYQTGSIIESDTGVVIQDNTSTGMNNTNMNELGQE